MKKLWILLPVTLLLILIMLCPVMAQGIRVFINNRIISFDQPPVMINGNVMVPMRGVFEELGADVKWRSATQTITAVKDSTEIIIQIGSNFASVNGNSQQLSAPAAMVRGRTLVPLRFISEALGADVEWQAASRTVMISSTAGSAEPQYPSSQQYTPPQTQSSQGPKISSVTHNASGPIQPGSVITVTLAGDSGGTATFDIAGISVNNLMNETSQGIYSGSFRIPESAGNIRNASIFGRLTRNGRETMLQAQSGVGIDAKYVKIMKVLPDENSTIKTNRPNILIVLESTGSSSLQSSSVNLMINNQRVGYPTVSNELVSYAVPFDLPQGQTSIAFSATDTSGNPVSKTWYFNVQTMDRIQSITHSATAPLAVGEVLQVRMQGDPGGTAAYSIGTYRTNNAMAETSSGVYMGNYQIQQGDIFQNAPVTGYLTLPGHSTISLNTTTSVSVRSSQLGLQITSPQSGSTVDKNFTISGQTSPYAKVSLNVSVYMGVLGIGMDNKLMESQVQANEAGNFQYAISDWFPVNGGSYTITGVAQDAQGLQSSIVTLKVNRR
ncbi:MAG: copper amine oxidase N-terminal domain-containing protein [Candidatus Eremiobacteraeota bacterium]|nr:copper amine oxidase N-terminal domain-containing protein [Candidatus Eremiobacteraeota bacterium]